jgi:hypothetical protein
MKHVIDRNGIRLTYTETFIESGKPEYIDLLDWNVIETELVPNFNFIKNKWNGSEWIEGATPEEIATIKQNELLNELIETCVLLTERSLISSVNKEGSEKFLQGQIERYKEKYKVAKQYVADQTINNQFWYDAIVIEMNNTNLIFNYGLDIPTFMGIIVQQFELGELRSQKFETAIEVFRCKTKDLIIANEFERAEACLEYGKNIPDQMTIEDLETFLTEFNGL